MSRIDAILHIADLPALVAAIAALDPARVTGGTITGFTSTPATRNGTSALVYVRLTAPEVAQWRGTPGVTVLAEAPYAEGSADVVYAALFASPEATALYDAVHDRSPQDDGEGRTWTPPERFGEIA